MTIRISDDTLVLVALVVGIFLLALVCLACSLNPRELLDGSLFRCCCHDGGGGGCGFGCGCGCCGGTRRRGGRASRLRRRQHLQQQQQQRNYIASEGRGGDDGGGGGEEDDGAITYYENLNEMIFESSSMGEEDSRGPQGTLAMNHIPTTMEQVFPDLLGSDETPTPPPPSAFWGGGRDRDMDIERGSLFGNTSGGNSRNAGGGSGAGNAGNAGSGNAELREPLL